MESITSDLLIYEVAKYLPVEDKCLLMYLLNKPNKYRRITFFEPYEFKGVPPKHRLAYYKRLGRLLPTNRDIPLHWNNLEQSKNCMEFKNIINYLYENNNFTKSDRRHCLIANDIKDDSKLEGSINNDLLLNNTLYAIGGSAPIATAYYKRYFKNISEILPALISVGSVDPKISIKQVIDSNKYLFEICLLYNQFDLFTRFYSQSSHKERGALLLVDYMDILSNSDKVEECVILLYELKEIHIYHVYQLIFYYGRIELLPWLLKIGNGSKVGEIIPRFLPTHPLKSADQLFINRQYRDLFDELIAILEKQSSGNSIANNLLLLLEINYQPNCVTRRLSKESIYNEIYWIFLWKREDLVVDLLDSINYVRTVIWLLMHHRFDILNKHRSLLRRCSIDRRYFKECTDPTLIELLIGALDAV